MDLPRKSIHTFKLINKKKKVCNIIYVYTFYNISIKIIIEQYGRLIEYFLIHYTTSVLV